MSLAKLNISQIAKMTKIDGRRLAEMLDGMPFEPGPKNSKVYCTKTVMAKIYAHQSHKRERDSARLARVRAERDLLEFRNTERRQELVHIEDIAQIVGEEFDLVRSEIRTLPQKMTEAVAGMRDPIAIKLALENSINEVLQKLSGEVA
jgi:hypothetical protein